MSIQYIDPSKYCQVCGFEVFSEPKPMTQWEYIVICPCCGLHYGNEDYAFMMEQAKKRYRHSKLNRLPKEVRIDFQLDAWAYFRTKWIDGGMEFWHQEDEPDDWNPYMQLENIAYTNGIYSTDSD